MTLPADAVTALALGVVGSVFASYGFVRLWVWSKNLLR